MILSITILISFIGGQIVGAALVRYGMGLCTKATNGELARPGTPTEQDYTGGIDEREDFAV